MLKVRYGVKKYATNDILEIHNRETMLHLEFKEMKNNNVYYQIDELKLNQFIKSEVRKIKGYVSHKVRISNPILQENEKTHFSLKLNEYTDVMKIPFEFKLFLEITTNDFKSKEYIYSFKENMKYNDQHLQ